MHIYHAHRLFDNHSFYITPYDRTNIDRGVYITFSHLRCVEGQTIDSAINSIVADFNLTYEKYGVPRLDINKPLLDWYKQARSLVDLANIKLNEEHKQRQEKKA